MTRWITRILGLLLLIFLIVMMVHLQKQLVELQDMRNSGGAATTTT